MTMPVTRRQISHATLRVNAVQGLGSLLLVGACWLGLSSDAHTAQSMAPSATESAAPKTAAPRSYQPKPHETLDQVIEHTLAGSPLKIEILRQAFVAQNPQAFMPGKVPKLRKGATLTVPDHEELLRIHLGARATPVVDPLQPVRAAPSTVEERKRWVQFP
jgi:hypothetical protein